MGKYSCCHLFPEPPPTTLYDYILYINKDKIGGFAAGAYWSSKESDDFNAWAQIFDDGFQNYANKDYQGYVRAVRAF